MIEDLLWRYDPLGPGLAQGLQAVVDGTTGLPQGMWLSDIRFVGVVQSVGLIFDVPAGADVRIGQGLVSVVVLVVQGASHVSAPVVRGPVVGWQVHRDEGVWTCQVSVGGSDDPVRIVGTRAIMFGGRTTNAPSQVPDGDVAQSVRAGIPSWSSPFTMTMIPGCSDSDIAQGYVQWALEEA
ncbi:MAG: hypothetical protein FWF43_09690 [Propionibacteriaceae bacterium]|nr:hypothetical protein [Propionibacteriaceae bacterium]